MNTVETVLYRGNDEKAVKLIFNLLVNNMNYETPMLIHDPEQLIIDERVLITEVLDGVNDDNHVVSVKYEYDYDPAIKKELN